MSLLHFDTVLSIKDQLEPRTFPFPREYVTEGWSEQLPMSAFGILNYISCYTVDGCTKQEIIEMLNEMNERKNDKPFLDFDAKPPRGKHARELYDEDLEIQTKIKASLERSGYSYPKTVEDMIELFKKFGIVFELQSSRGPILDVLLSPYPPVEMVLKIDQEAE